MIWVCPHCNQPTTLTSPNIDNYWHAIDIAAEHINYGHRLGIGYVAIACPNKECKKLFLKTRLTQSDSTRPFEETTGMEVWQLLPESNAKPQPTYIPTQIRQDYTEACRIKSLSPKASATLARRCLQGMIRDFWSIKKGTLQLEINELETHLSPEVWEAIDAVRDVGNIGAHMEKDVNVIVEISPEEADLLIGLVEDLLVDWYVVRHDREQRQIKLKELAQSKSEAKKEKPPKNN
jgi:hypothetical protein